MNNEQIKIAEHRAAERVDFSTPICEMCEEAPAALVEVNWPNQKYYRDEVCADCRQDIEDQNS